VNEIRWSDEKEQFYDEEIAPKLKELMEQCADKGLSFLALVEYEPDCGRGITAHVTPDAGLGMHMTRFAVAAGINFDGFCINFMRYCNENNIDLSQTLIGTLLKKGES
jgi:hypothetical protein